MEKLATKFIGTWSWLFVLPMLLLLSGCGNKQKIPPEMPWPWPYWGEASSSFNNESWEAEPFAVHDTLQRSITLIMTVLSESFIRKENMGIYRFPDTPGVYPIFNKEDSADEPYGRFFYVDEDVTEAWYDVVKGDSTGFIELLSFDETSGELTGTFSMTLVLTENISEPDPPDTIRIRNGWFHTRLVE